MTRAVTTAQELDQMLETAQPCCKYLALCSLHSTYYVASEVIRADIFSGEPVMGR